MLYDIEEILRFCIHVSLLSTDLEYFCNRDCHFELGLKKWGKVGEIVTKAELSSIS